MEGFRGSSESLSDTISKGFGKAKDAASGKLKSARQALGMEPEPEKKNVAPIRKYSKPVSGLTPHYTVFIYQAEGGMDGRGIGVHAHLPETFNFDLQSEYSTPFSDSGSTSGAVNKFSKLVGVSTITQFSTAQFWSGSTHVSFNLPLTFVANSSSEEVMLPIQRLIQMSLPRNVGDAPGNGFLVAPGARWVLKNPEKADDVIKDLGDSFWNSGKVALSDAQVGEFTKSLSSVTEKLNSYVESHLTLKNKVSIRIGKMLWFDNVVIKNIQQTYASRFDKNGYPMKVEVSLTVETMMAPTQRDLLIAMGALFSLDKAETPTIVPNSKEETADDAANKKMAEDAQKAQDAKKVLAKMDVKTAPAFSLPM